MGDRAPEAGGLELTASRRGWWRTHLSGIDRRESWGYGVWFVAGVAIGVPEIWAAAGDPPWPTISGTVGHLEERWDFVAVIVVVLIVIVAAYAAKSLWSAAGGTRVVGSDPNLTEGGRLTKEPASSNDVPGYVYSHSLW